MKMAENETYGSENRFRYVNENTMQLFDKKTAAIDFLGLKPFLSFKMVVVIKNMTTIMQKKIVSTRSYAQKPKFLNFGPKSQKVHFICISLLQIWL